MTTVRAAAVVKLLVLGNSLLSSFILALKEGLVAKLVLSGILSSIILILPFWSYLFQQYDFLVYHFV